VSGGPTFRPTQDYDVEILSMDTVQPRPGREWISGAVVAVGLGLVAFGGWPLRRRPAPGP
jgi:hypothetical protein